MLKWTGADYEIELPVTVPPIGAVARLEHALLNIGAERLSYRNRLGDAERRPASDRPHLGEVFALGAEIALTRNELGLVEQGLAWAGQINGIRDDDRDRFLAGDIGFRVSMKVAMPVQTCGGRKNGRHQIPIAQFA
jgi:hypothetical protein